MTITNNRHILTDSRGDVWEFLLNLPDNNVVVHSPSRYNNKSCQIAHATIFSNALLEQLHQEVVLELIKNSQLFDSNYPYFHVLPYKTMDTVRNTTEIGIQIRFTKTNPSLTMNIEDARKLWSLLKNTKVGEVGSANIQFGGGV